MRFLSDFLDFVTKSESVFLSTLSPKTVSIQRLLTRIWNNLTGTNNATVKISYFGITVAILKGSEFGQFMC